MLYRSPFSTTTPLFADNWRLLTSAQKVFLAERSMEMNISIKELLDKAAYMVEQINADSQEVFLMGEHPWCGLYGSITPDGTAHT